MQATAFNDQGARFQIGGDDSALDTTAETVRVDRIDVGHLTLHGCAIQVDRLDNRLLACRGGLAFL